MNYYEIGQRIRKIRKTQDLSQDELAARVNISATHMSHIETGNTKLSLPVLLDIADALNVTANDLLYSPSSISTDNSISVCEKVFSECSPSQAKIIACIVESTAVALKKYSDDK